MSLNYQDYLDRVTEYYVFCTPENFSGLVDTLFPYLDYVDWSNYDPEDHSIVEYILNELISIDGAFYVTGYNADTKTVQAVGFRSEKELKEAIKSLEQYGWSLDPDLVEELKEEFIDRDEAINKAEIIRRLSNLSLEELQKISIKYDN